MSDWIEHDGKTYYEASYLILANENARRHRLDSKRLDWLESHVQGIRAAIDAAMELNSADSTVSEHS